MYQRLFMASTCVLNLHSEDLHPSWLGTFFRDSAGRMCEMTCWTNNSFLLAYWCTSIIHGWHQDYTSDSTFSFWEHWDQQGKRTKTNTAVCVRLSDNPVPQSLRHKLWQGFAWQMGKDWKYLGLESNLCPQVYGKGALASWTMHPRRILLLIVSTPKSVAH